MWDKNLLESVIHATNLAAIEASKYIGRKDKIAADGAATQAMRNTLAQIPFSGKVVVGEGTRDEAPMLYLGEELGTGGEAIDIAVDPVEGTKLVAQGQNHAISIFAMAPQGTLLSLPDMYMLKLAVGKMGKEGIDIRKSLTENLEIYQKNTGKNREDIVVVILDRPRHEEYMKEIIDFGARVQLIAEGDIYPTLLTYRNAVDMVYGIGASAEGVISASMAKVFDGDFQGILKPRNEDEIQALKSCHIDYFENKVFTLNDFVKTHRVFVTFSAITDGYLADGVEEDDLYFYVRGIQCISSEASSQPLREPILKSYEYVYKK